jgi:hypothetical protein
MVADNDQTEKRYWQQIEDKFFKYMPQVATSMAPIDPYKTGGMQSKLVVAIGVKLWSKCGTRLQGASLRLTM